MLLGTPAYGLDNPDTALEVVIVVPNAELYPIPIDGRVERIETEEVTVVAVEEIEEGVKN